MTRSADSLPQSRHLATAIPGPASAALHREREAHVSSGFGVTLPVFINRASGGILEDVDGNRIIDFASGIAVTSVGAVNAQVQAQVAAQMARFTHTCFMVTEYDSFTQVAAWLNAHIPGDFPKRTALFSTGAEAVENAVKIARAATGRERVLVFDDAYHGRSLLTMAMTAKVNPYKKNFGPFPGEVFRAPTATRLWARTGEDATAATALAGVEALLHENDPRTFAAMVIEPIQGEGGFLVPAPGFLAGLRELATKYGIVLVMDEIQTGMGRTGKLFASEHEGVAGDLTLTAKALAGGLPLSAVTGRAELMNAPHAGGLGGTYAGNPVACAAALGCLRGLRRRHASGERPGHRGGRPRGSAAPRGQHGHHRGVPRPRRHARRRIRGQGHPGTARRSCRPGGCSLPPAGRSGPCLRHLRQCDPAAAAPGHRPGIDPRRPGRAAQCHRGRQ